MLGMMRDDAGEGEGKVACVMRCDVLFRLEVLGVAWRRCASRLRKAMKMSRDLVIFPRVCPVVSRSAVKSPPFQCGSLLYGSYLALCMPAMDIDSPDQIHGPCVPFTQAFWDSLAGLSHTAYKTALEAYSTALAASPENQRIHLRESQVLPSVNYQEGCDVLYISGTGSGKTMQIISLLSSTLTPSSWSCYRCCACRRRW